MIPRSSNNERLTDISTTSFLPTLVNLIAAASNSVAALVSWLIYECSNTVDQRMIPESSNAKRLTNVGTTSFMPTSVCLSLLLPLTVSLHSYHGL